MRFHLLSLFIAVGMLCAAEPARKEAVEPKVMVHLIEPLKENGAPNQKKFWIDWRDVWYAIVETKTVSGKQAASLVELMEQYLLNSEAMHFCGHSPVYGIVARRADGQLLKTSLCFTCGTWVRPGKRLYLGGEPGIKNPLCLELRKVIELPESVLKEPQHGDAVKP